MTALLEVTDLATGYARAPILRDVSLQVAPGEVVGLLGANGAGKTTLLRAVSGTLRPWSGSIRFEGADTVRWSPWRRVRSGLVHVPEGRHVFGALTLRENLLAAVQATGRDPGALDDVYQLFPRLSGRENQLAGSLSGGEQQMLAIARALATRPRLLCVDEMSAGLAPVVVRDLIRGIARIRERGIGVLLVEQSPHLAAEVVDRVVLLEHGRVTRQGSIDALGGAASLANLYLGVNQ